MTQPNNDYDPTHLDDAVERVNEAFRKLYPDVEVRSPAPKRCQCGADATQHPQHGGHVCEMHGEGGESDDGR